MDTAKKLTIDDILRKKTNEKNDKYFDKRTWSDFITVKDTTIQVEWDTTENGIDLVKNYDNFRSRIE